MYVPKHGIGKEVGNFAYSCDRDCVRPTVVESL